MRSNSRLETKAVLASQVCRQPRRSRPREVANRPLTCLLVRQSLDMPEPHLPVICPGLQIALAQFGFNRLQPPQRSVQGVDHAPSFVLWQIVAANHLQDSPNETLAFIQELGPVPVICVECRSPLVEQPVDPLRQYIAEFFRLGPTYTAKWIKMFLAYLSSPCDGPQSSIGVQHKKPVIVIDVRKE
jgi:hypothetical protein